MEPRQYRIKAPTMAIFSAKDQRFHVTLPVGVIVEVPPVEQPHDRLINIVWNNTTYLMFEEDLRTRGEPVD